MELKNYLQILWRRKWTVAATLATTLTITTIGLLITPNVYRSSAKLHVTTVTQGSLEWVDYEIDYAERLMNTYVNIASSGAFRNDLADRLGVSQSALIDTDVSIIANTELIRISAEAENPELAYDAANMLALMVIEQGHELSTKAELVRQESLARELAEVEAEISRLQGTYDSLSADEQSTEDGSLITELKSRKAYFASLNEAYQQARVLQSLSADTISLIAPAETPSRPVRPDPLLYLLLGFGTGLIGGLGLAFMFENLALSSYNEQLERLIHLQPQAFSYPEREWTLLRLSEHMARQTGITQSPSRVRILLEGLGYRNWYSSSEQHQTISSSPQYSRSGMPEYEAQTTRTTSLIRKASGDDPRSSPDKILRMGRQ